MDLNPLAIVLDLGVTAMSFSVWTEFTVATGKMREHPRGMPLVTRMQELEANRRVIQWHARV